MEDKKISRMASKIAMEKTIQQVLDIFEADDGKSFVQKKQDVMKLLDDMQADLLTERVTNVTINDIKGKNIKTKFWNDEEILKRNTRILLRCVQDSDKEKYIELQKETCVIKSMLKEEAYQNMLWNELIQDRSLMFTIEVDNEYAGYCGINDVSKDNWEIAIELLKKFHRQGVGYSALGIMLSEIKSRLEIDTFRVKIDADNYASQHLFEKLGATPYGVAEFMLHREEDIVRCEEENRDLINERLIETAQKFGVEPRVLLSHVLEYELKWLCNQSRKS